MIIPLHLHPVYLITKTQQALKQTGLHIGFFPSPVLVTHLRRGC